MFAELLEHYGYALIFLAAAAEGDATLVTGSFLARRGYFALDRVMAVAALATVSINQVYFWTARAYGQQKASELRAHRTYGRVLDWVARVGIPLVVFSRFVYGFRIAIPAACGALRMSPLRFFVCDVIGAVCWAVVVGLAGYAIGHALTIALDDIRRHEWWLAMVLFVGLAVLSAIGASRARS